jgi:multidrug efflux pump subunit AcrA (membrane-fusion protein)
MTEPPAARTFTQDELTAIVQREKAQAQAAQARAIAEQLGCTVEEAKAKLEKAAADEAAAMSAAERAKREADEAAAKAAKELAEARALRRDTAVERALVRAGYAIPEDDKDGEALAYGVRLLSGLAADAGQEAIVAEVETLKKRLPGLFTATGGAGGGDVGGASGGVFGGAPSSDGRPPHRPSTPEQPWGSAGVDEAVRRGIVKDRAAAGV